MVASVENLRQGKDEDSIKYAERARGLLHDLNLAYKPLTAQLKNENDRRVARYFVRGLNNHEVKRLIPLGVISNLDDSIAQVLNLEATTGTNVSARDLFCQVCRSVGHRESSCKIKNRDTNELLTSLLVSMTTGGNGAQMNRNIPNFNRNRLANPHYNNWSSNNHGLTQNRGNFTQYVPQPNMHNFQNQNRGNFNTQMSSQQPNSNRNRPNNPNTNLRMINMGENEDNLNQEQETSRDYPIYQLMDFPEQYVQNDDSQASDSGNSIW